MVSYKTLKTPIKLKISEDLYSKLHGHLFPGDGDEHGAVILAGLAETKEVTWLLAREVILAIDGIHFVPGEYGYKMLKAEFIHDQIDQCERERLVYLAVHNHGGSDSVGFSPVDFKSHERGYPALLDILDGLPVGALVLAKHAIAGDIWLPGGSRVILDSAEVIGNTRSILYPKAHSNSKLKLYSRYDRQIRLFGAVGQNILQNAHVAIIGVGGVGSMLVEFLARLGIGIITIIDPDHIEDTNLPRLICSCNEDISMSWLEKIMIFLKLSGTNESNNLKIDYAERIAKNANKNIKIRKYPNNFLEKDIAKKVLTADYIFLAADQHQARLLFNAIVHQYLIPGAQIGSKIHHHKGTGEVLDVFSAYRPLTTVSGCLMCNGLIDRSRLGEESLGEIEKQRQRYVYDEDVPAPSVIGINAIGVSQAINKFMMYITGLSQGSVESDYVIYNALDQTFDPTIPRSDNNCRECSICENSRYAMGDLMSLPTQQ